eukprot:545854-Hanusia_phi.AAC.3
MKEVWVYLSRETLRGSDEVLGGGGIAKDEARGEVTHQEEPLQLQERNKRRTQGVERGEAALAGTRSGRGRIWGGRGIRGQGDGAGRTEEVAGGRGRRGGVLEGRDRGGAGGGREQGGRGQGGAGEGSLTNPEVALVRSLVDGHFIVPLASVKSERKVRDGRGEGREGREG